LAPTRVSFDPYGGRGDCYCYSIVQKKTEGRTEGLHPLGIASTLGDTSGGQLNPKGSHFAPRGEIKNRPLASDRQPKHRPLPFFILTFQTELKNESKNLRMKISDHCVPVCQNYDYISPILMSYDVIRLMASRRSSKVVRRRYIYKSCLLLRNKFFGVNIHNTLICS
jgi:hypothetical protein